MRRLGVEIAWTKDTNKITNFILYPNYAFYSARAQIVLHLAAPCLCARFAKEKGSSMKIGKFANLTNKIKSIKICHNINQVMVMSTPEALPGHLRMHRSRIGWINWINAACVVATTLWQVLLRGKHFRTLTSSDWGCFYFATNGSSTFCAFQHLLTNILSTPAFLNAEWVILNMNSASPPGGICIGFCICFCVCFIFLLFAEVVTYEECTSSIKVAETGFSLGSCQWENGAWCALVDKRYLWENVLGENISMSKRNTSTELW